MTRRKAQRCAWAVLGGGLLGFVLVAGCNKPDTGAAPGGNRPGPGGGPGTTAGADTAAADVPPQFAAARKVFDANCARCHTLAGTGDAGPGDGPPPGGPPPGGPPPGGPEGGGPGGRGPRRKIDLGKEGANHPADWIAGHIRDPQSQKPESRMPKFAGKLSDGDIQAVADYLASLKG